MKIGTFIKIIADSFSSQIEPSESTGRTSNQLKYQTVLSWFTSYDSDEIELVNEVMMKGKDNYCNKIMNPGLDDDMPINHAGILKSKVSSDLFKDVFNDANLDDLAIQSLIQKFKDDGIKLSKSNIVDDLARTFYELLDKRSIVNKKGSIRQATFLDNETVKIGTRIIKLPNALKKPNLPATRENKYVGALLQVYAQIAKKGTISISDLDTMPVVYKKHLELSREDFYSAESVLHQVRDLFNDAEKEFNNMKDEVYEGIKYTLNAPYKDGFERVNKVMDTVITISFRKSYFASQGNGMIGPGEERGMVHILVNDGRVEWIQEDIDE